MSILSPLLIFTNLSIHDLTRRSTRISLIIRDARTFQFTTSQGGRRGAGRADDIKRNSFNSRPHKEVDCIRITVGILVIHLSIHDLTRRSTIPVCIVSCSLCPFNSRPHKEVDPLLSLVHTQAPGLSIHDLTRRSTASFQNLMWE